MGQIKFKDIEVEMGDARDKDPKAEPKGNEADNKTKKAEPSGDEAEPSPKRSKIDGAGTELSEKLLRARSRAESLEDGNGSPSFLDKRQKQQTDETAIFRRKPGTAMCSSHGDDREPGRPSAPVLPSVDDHDRYLDQDVVTIGNEGLNQPMGESLEVFLTECIDTYLADVSKEVSIKELEPWERELFARSDLEGWSSITSLNVVRMLSVEEEFNVKSRCPERTMKSRYVRTKKPTADAQVVVVDTGGRNLNGENLNRSKPNEIATAGETVLLYWKAKSRWIVKGFSGPDAIDAERSSPVSTPRSLYLSLILAAARGWKVNIGDIKTAYLNSPVREGRVDLFMSSYHRTTQSTQEPLLSF